MKLSRWALLVAAAPLVAGCSLGQALNAHKDELATAAGKELKADQAADLIAANPQVPATPDVVRELADRWVDYTLLATALSEDTTLAVLDLDKLVQNQREGETIQRLLHESVHVDTTLTDAQLEQAWATQGPGQEVHARHILLKLPPDATPAQRDSVRKQAESIRAQAAGGADFATLAKKYSQDPSAQQGGDLGYFGHGQMVPQFEQAAFALQPGQISPVVESPFGFHVIKVEDKRMRPLGNDKAQFRQYLVQKQQQDAANKFVDSLTAAAHVQVESGAPQQVKEMAKNPGATLRGRAADRKLATFRGGDLTAGEVQQEMQNAPPEALKQVSDAPDSSVSAIIKNQATKKVLLAEARRRNIGLSPQENQQLRDQARQTIQQLVQVSGLAQHRAPKGQAGNPVIEQSVLELLKGAVTGQRQMPPLGVLGTQLRSIYGFNVNDAAFQRVIDRVKSIRATQPQVPQGTPGGMTQPGAAPQQGAPQAAPQPAPPPAAQPQGAAPAKP